ncbi:MAG: hypothetical protein K2P09_00020 [Erysipelotrichales bacterium]|nr:hypothetical protein [Erysipelotrichales bacterium]
MSTIGELNSIKNELRLIIRELEEIAIGINDEFQGIGEEKCVECIRLDIEKYRKSLSQLDRVNLSRIKKEFENVGEVFL